ncbi:MAG: mannosyltransferase [Thermoleophilaceae bacterium]|nr:mannosyltransferase [Thermoleophilaceae bacterium]
MQRGTWAVVAGLTAVAFGIRLAQLDQSLFGDELFMYRIVAHHDLGRVVSLVHDTESTPPLHFVLAWLGAQLGDPITGIRLPSLLAGTALVPATFLLGRRAAGAVAGLVGAAVVAIAPFAIFYGVEGRAYALLGLLSALSTLALLRALEERSRGRWALFAALTLAVLYTHYAGVFVVVAQGAWAAWRHRDRLRELAFAYGAVAIGYVPWIPSFLVQRRDSAAVRIEDAYPLTPGSAVRGLLKVVPGHPLQPLASIPGRIALGVFLAALGAATVLVAMRRLRERSPGPRRGLELLVVAAAASPAGALVYSLGPESVFLPRNLMPSLPAAALLLGALAAGAGRLAAPVMGAVLVAVLAVGAVKTFDGDFERPSYGDAAVYVESHGRPGDAVLEVSIDAISPAGGPLAPELDDSFLHARLGHRGTAAALARGRARGRLFLVVPQVGVLRGAPPPQLRGFRLTAVRRLPQLAVFAFTARRAPVKVR